MRSYSRTPDIPAGQGRILVADDDRDTLLSVSDQLAALGFDVVEEESAASALSRIVSEVDHGAISGMLLELKLPWIGGLVLFEEIRDRYPNIPVIVMSDAANIARLRTAVELGASEYLVKPFDAEILKRKCLQIFRNADQRT